MKSKVILTKSQESLLDGLFNAICCEIDEPAGHGCGYGITDRGYEAVRELISEFNVTYDGILDPYCLRLKKFTDIIYNKPKVA